MSRRGARLTQSEYDRICKAAAKSGLDARIEYPDGTVLTIMGKVTESGNDNNNNNEWDQVFDGKDQTKTRSGV